MTRYITNYGTRVEARTPTGIVSALRKESFTRSKTSVAFMREVAARMKVQNRKAEISTRSEKEFVDSLVRAGFLKEEPAE